jgi:N-acetylmuramic acid 6-phosphate etherase
MSAASDQRSDEFLKISGQFKLGALVTESSHPLTANLSTVAKQDIAKALDLLFQVDNDVLAKYREFVHSGRAGEIHSEVLRALRNGGRIFFTGCGATGRLSIQLTSIWRGFWQQQHPGGSASANLEPRAFSVMAGGDFALIKSVEGFEDFAVFGAKQLGDLGVSEKDVVFAITEGGETSFVIGTVWKGVEAGAKVYFVYNNPDAILCEHVQRSREVIEDSRVEKINLTTGPMAITGSTRMQATSIQLCVMLTILEMVLCDLLRESNPRAAGMAPAASVPQEFLAKLTELHATLRSPEVLAQIAKMVALEESIYRSGCKNNYCADRFGIDVLTDTTERSPTYCTPPFRKFNDASAAESWSFLFLPDQETEHAWQRILRREPSCVEWSESEIRALVSEDKAPRCIEVIRKIRRTDLMSFRIGLDGMTYRGLTPGDSAIAVVAEAEKDLLLSPEGFFRAQLADANKVGAKLGLIYFGSDLKEAELSGWITTSVFVPVPQTEFLIDGVTRVGAKMLLNALSTCTMVRLGRVMGNCMIWVVASNLKLIDRATRYIQRLTGMPYEKANRLLFEVVEYIEPRMKADQAYPPVVGLSVLRARLGISNEEAEARLKQEIG